MGFAQWFWRLLAVFAGLIAAHVLVVTMLILQGSMTPGPIWTTAIVTIGIGAAAMWYCIRRIVEPLHELSRQVRSAVPGDQQPSPAMDGQDELGVLSGAFSRMQRDLAQRLAQIQDNHQRLATVLSSMVEGVLAVGPDRTILLANDAARQLLEFATPAPVGRPLLEVTRARPVDEATRQAFSAASPVVIEFDAPGPARRSLSLRATRLPGEPCPGVVLVLHDMTELRRLESLRRELVANVSHELKTPLSAIKGYAETLRLGALNDPEHNVHFVRRIEEQTDRLHELILDLLQLARIESGQETFELTDVPLGNLIEHCVAQFAELAASKQIQLATNLPPSDITARADEEGLRTILSNLVDNAVKYTPSGGCVEIRGTADKSSVILEVSDTGIGIAPRDQARIFERFYRVDKARSRELGGTGLGLSIVKHLAQAFGGNVTVESQPGRGSMFRVELPKGSEAREQT